MARLYSTGFELNSAAVELSNRDGTLSISSTTKLSGTYSLKASEVGGSHYGYFVHVFSDADIPVTFYRTNVSIEAATDQADGSGVLMAQASVAFDLVGILMLPNRTFILYDMLNEVQIGSPSSVLALNTFARLELKVDMTTPAATAVEAKLNGTTFASGSANFSSSGHTGCQSCAFGVGYTYLGTTGIVYHDDIAINDNSGTKCNSFPGEGHIIHLRPNAAGDNAGWNEGTGVTFAEVDEVAPNDNTDYISETSEDVISDFNIDNTPAEIDSNSIINTVHVGLRFGGTDGVQANIKPRIKSTTGGSVEEGPEIQPAGSSWYTNNSEDSKNYRLILYGLPGAPSTPYSKSTLDTTQVGVRVSEGNTDPTKVTALWLLVDYTPSSTSSTTIQKSLKYTVVQAVSAITKALSYMVKTSPTIQKSLQYKILGEAPTIQKALTYMVKRSLSAITKSLQYIVKSSPTITKSLQYSIVGEILPGTTTYKSKYLPNKLAPTGYNCFVQQYIKNLLEHSPPMKLPDGTLF